MIGTNRAAEPFYWKSTGTNITRMAATKANPYYQSTTSPYGHKIRLKAVSSSYAPKYISDRSLTVNTIQITPRTVFELERPQSYGSPRILIDINTFFQKGYFDKYKPKKRVPIFPKLATDSITKKRPQTRAVEDSGRNSQNHNTLQRPGSCFTPRESSSAMLNRKTSAGLRRTLSERQNSTFAAYAKYNDELKASAKDDEREIEDSEREIKDNAQTPTILNLNGFVMANRAPFPRFLSNEKQLRIADWVASTSKAVLRDTTKEEVMAPTSLGVIQEQ